MKNLITVLFGLTLFVSLMNAIDIEVANQKLEIPSTKDEEKFTEVYYCTLGLEYQNGEQDEMTFRVNNDYNVKTVYPFIKNGCLYFMGCKEIQNVCSLRKVIILQEDFSEKTIK